jgi:glycosyltransferase involved in cell wall biosynthesis
MEVSIVVPAYNEQENLPKLIKSLKGLKHSLKDFEIVIVDDNSSDKTGIIADSYSGKYGNVRVLHRKKGINGMGAALKEGTRISKGKYIIWVMADNSDDLNSIPKFVSKLRNDCDLVFGSRYTKGGSKGDLGAFKALMSSGYSFAAGLIFGLNVHDITNAFRAFKKEIFNNIELESNDFAISPEFAIKAHLKGCRLGEVPTTYRNRKAGTTKFRLIKMGAAYCRLFKHRFGHN